METRKTFSRFKYAEEFAHGVDDDDRKWIMYRDDDETFEEDGETYTNPVYVVEYE